MKSNVPSNTEYVEEKLALQSRQDLDAVKPFNAFAVIYFCICRWVWLFNPHAYSKGITGQIMYGKGLRNILVSTPQVVCLVAVTLLIQEEDEIA